MNFTARVKTNNKINDKISEIVLVHDEDLFYFNSGQYVWIETKYGRRAFSISSSSKNPKEIKILFKSGIDSAYMRYLGLLKIGDAVKLIGPRGGMRIPAEDSKTIFLAGGVGITPFLSIIRSLVDSNISRDITLVTFNSSEELEIFSNEIKEISKKDRNIKYIPKVGKIDSKSLSSIKNLNSDYDWYVIGSQGFVDSAYLALKELKINKDKIYFEENFPSVDEMKSLSEKDSFFRKVTDQSAIHIIVTDSNGVIKYANLAAEKMTGYSADQMIGNTPRLWGGLMDKETYVEFWRTIKVEKKVYIGELRNVRASGEEYDVLATVSPIIEADKLVGFIGMEQDITEEKKTRDELKKIRDLMIDRVLEEDKKL